MAGPAAALGGLDDIMTHDELAAKYMLLVSITLLIYDHVLTMDDEITFLWRSKFGVAPAIVIVNRYLVLGELSIDLYELFGGPHSLLFCEAWTGFQGYLSVLSYMSIHALVALRVHALYGGLLSIRRTLFLAGSLSLIFSMSVATMSFIAIAREKFLLFCIYSGYDLVWSLLGQMTPSLHLCVIKIPSYLWVIYLPSVLLETYLFALTLFAAVSRMRDGQDTSSLCKILCRDGIFYFIAVFICTVFTLLAWAVAPPAFIYPARYFSQALLVIAGSRLVLNLKGYAAEQNSYDKLDSNSPLAFRVPGLPASQYGGSSDHPNTPTDNLHDHERGW